MILVLYFRGHRSAEVDALKRDRHYLVHCIAWFSTSAASKTKYTQIWLGPIPPSCTAAKLAQYIQRFRTTGLPVRFFGMTPQIAYGVVRRALGDDSTDARLVATKKALRSRLLRLQYQTETDDDCLRAAVRDSSVAVRDHTSRIFKRLEALVAYAWHKTHFWDGYIVYDGCFSPLPGLAGVVLTMMGSSGKEGTDLFIATLKKEILNEHLLEAHSTVDSRTINAVLAHC